MTADTLPPTRRQMVAGVTVIPRPEFLTHYWRYERGQHVTILGRTHSGKTTLAYQLLGETAHPKLPAIILVMKRTDDTATEWSEALNLPRVRTWPLMPNPMRRQPNGWTLWPDLPGDPEEDDRRLYHVFRSAIIDTYKRGRRILFADEIVDVADLDDPDANESTRRRTRLSRPLDAIWKRGRSEGAGLWAATQRPAGMSYHGYSAPEHLFLAFDPDKRTRQRYDEIGGIIDPGMVRDVTAQLPRFHWLYLQRSTSTYCVVGP